MRMWKDDIETNLIVCVAMSDGFRLLMIRPHWLVLLNTTIKLWNL